MRNDKNIKIYNQKKRIDVWTFWHNGSKSHAVGNGNDDVNVGVNIKADSDKDCSYFRNGLNADKEEEKYNNWKDPVKQKRNVNFDIGITTNHGSCLNLFDGKYKRNERTKKNANNFRETEKDKNNNISGIYNCGNG